MYFFSPHPKKRLAIFFRLEFITNYHIKSMCDLFADILYLNIHYFCTVKYLSVKTNVSNK